MLSPQFSGKWKKLTAALDGITTIRLHDRDMLDTVGSWDQTRPLPLRQGEQYSIWARARDAGYDVQVDPNDRFIKIFTKMSAADPIQTGDES